LLSPKPHKPNSIIQAQKRAKQLREDLTEDSQADVYMTIDDPEELLFPEEE
jgi:hypothetical protein